jgi:hypothetical protein
MPGPPGSSPQALVLCMLGVVVAGEEQGLGTLHPLQAQSNRGTVSQSSSLNNRSSSRVPSWPQYLQQGTLELHLVGPTMLTSQEGCTMAGLSGTT